MKQIREYEKSLIYSKSLILNVLRSFLFIALIILMTFFIQSYKDFGYAVDKYNNIQIGTKRIRTWFMFILIVYCFVSFFVMIFNIKKYESTRQILESVCCTLIPFSFIYEIFNCLDKNYLSEFFCFEKSNRDEAEQISHYDFWLWISGRKKSDKLIRNTLLFYVTVLLTTVGTLLIFIPSPRHTINQKYFIFNTLSFFTQENNLQCWFFLIIFAFLSKKQMFRNNTWMLYSAIYISVVGIVADTMIGPYVLLNSDAKTNMDAHSMVKFIWMHVVTPIMFTWFCFNSISQSYKKPNSYLKFTISGCIYPSFYGVYLYSLPFISGYSVYGRLTNFNKDIVSTYKNATGDILVAFCLILLFLLFVGMISLYWYINVKIVNNKTKFKCYR